MIGCCRKVHGQMQ